MSAGEKVAAAALSYQGTPFKHRGRKPGEALDCAGVCLCAAWEAGLNVADCVVYGPDPDPAVVMAELSARAFDVPDMHVGDILLFAFTQHRPAHFGIWTGNAYVHAHRGRGAVIAHGLTIARMKELHSIWRFRGCMDG